jgi:hypothetical protein
MWFHVRKHEQRHDVDGGAADHADRAVCSRSDASVDWNCAPCGSGPEPDLPGKSIIARLGGGKPPYAAIIDHDVRGRGSNCA